MIRAIYHLYADGQWRRPLAEHLMAMRSIEAEWQMDVGIVGSIENAEAVAAILPPDVDYLYLENGTGWEQDTINSLLIRALDTCWIEGDDLVLYAHTKGAANPSPINEGWRQCMTRRLIYGWADVLGHFATGADTVGCHWLTPEAYPHKVGTPYYGGNFWWATAEHLRRLREPSDLTRYHAEAWLGSVRPDRPVDLHPVWPGAACATTPTTRRRRDPRTA